MPTTPLQIDALPQAPSRSDSPDDFVSHGDLFVSKLPPLVTQINAVSMDLVTKYDIVVQKEAVATSGAQVATTKAVEASGSAGAAAGSAAAAAGSAAAAALSASALAAGRLLSVQVYEGTGLLAIPTGGTFIVELQSSGGGGGGVPALTRGGGGGGGGRGLHHVQTYIGPNAGAVSKWNANRI